MKTNLIMLAACTFVNFSLHGQFSSDVITTSSGDLEMFFVGHGTLMFRFDQKVIHIDPTMREADYSTMPDADLILVTHQHGDHLDLTAINHILKEDTRVVMTQTCMEQLEDFEATVMRNGDNETIMGIGIKAIPRKIAWIIRTFAINAAKL